MNSTDRLKELDELILEQNELIFNLQEKVKPLHNIISQARRFDSPNRLPGRGLREKKELDEITKLINQCTGSLKILIERRERLVSLKNENLFSIKDINDLIEHLESKLEFYESNYEYKREELLEAPMISNNVNYINGIRNEFEEVSEKKFSLKLILSNLKQLYDISSNQRIFKVDESNYNSIP